MDENKIKEAVSELKKSKKRNFKQAIDLIINLKNLDLKKPEHQVEFFLQLPKYKGKKTARKINKKRKRIKKITMKIRNKGRGRRRRRRKRR